MLQRPRHVGQRREIGPVGRDDLPRDHRQVIALPAQIRDAATQIVDDRLEVRRIEHRQRIGGGRASAAAQIDLAAEVAAGFEVAQRAAQRLEKRQQQGQEQLIIMKLAVAVAGQIAQPLQVPPEQRVRIVRRCGVSACQDGASHRKHNSVNSATATSRAQVKILRMSRSPNPGRFWRGARAT